MNNDELFDDKMNVNDNEEITSEVSELSSMANEDEMLISKYEKEIEANEEKLNDESLSSIEKEMIRSKIRSLNLNITSIKMKSNNE